MSSTTNGLLIRFAAVACLFLIAGCRPGVVVSPDLPAYLTGDGHGGCAETEPLEPAVWADAADALLIGTVAEVRAHPMPYQEGDRWFDDPPPELHEPEECTGRLLPALQVRLSDVTVYAGERPEGDVVLTFGASVLAHVWGHDWGDGGSIIAESDGSVTWLHPDDGRIEPGQRLGVDLLCDPDWGYCGNARQPLFQIDHDDRVRFQAPTGGCPAPVPEGLDGSNVDAFASIIQGSRQEVADLDEKVAKRRSRVLDRARFDRYQNFFAAYCLSDGSGCDPACPMGQICIDSECVVDDLEDTWEE
jgi:hypothetical protein